MASRAGAASGAGEQANSWLERRVLAYAHQGGAKEGPSSTLHAIGAAIAAGADAIELDVHATRDRELVVLHDPTLDRTTNGAGFIAERTLEQLASLDNAYWYVPGHDAVRGLADDAYPLRGRAPTDQTLGVASLRAVLEAFPGVPLNLDIKRTAPEVLPYEAVLAPLLRAYGRTDDVIVASFHDRATDELKRLAPEIPTSAGRLAVRAFTKAVWSHRRPPPELARHVALQVPTRLRGGVPLVTRRFVHVAHEAGLAVHAWTVDDPAEMERLVGCGVDGIMTDRPSVLAAVLDRLGATWKPGAGGTVLGWGA